MSIRSARRIGPSQQIVFDLVAEVVQRCEVAGGRGTAFPVYGGSTVIFGPDGEIRYIISKSVLGAGRIDRRAQFLAGPLGVRYWTVEQGAYRPRERFFASLHGGARHVMRRPRAVISLTKVDSAFVVFQCIVPWPGGRDGRRVIWVEFV
jgi:hypothetical protein